MSNNETGFTLIELMITIAIVGILAAIALPAYQDYTIKSQVTEGFILGQEAKSNVIEYHSSKGVLPDNSNEANYASTKGKYVGSIEVESRGKIVATFSKDSPQKSNKKIHGKRLILTPVADTTTGNLIWTCSSDMDDIFVPTSCH